MNQSRATTIAQLPVVWTFVPKDDWYADLMSASTSLFAHDVGLLTDGEGGVVVVNNADLRKLAETEVLGNSPVEYIVGKAIERAMAVEGEELELSDEGVGAMIEFLGNQLFTLNPPLHTDLRQVVGRRLLPRAVMDFIPHAERVFDEILLDVANTGPVGFARTVAAPYVARFWSYTLGIGEERAERIAFLMDEMSHMFLYAPTNEDARRLLNGAVEYVALVRQSVNEAWERGDNKFLRDLADGLAAIDLPDKPSSVGSVVVSNFFDAFHTIGVALTNATHHLLANPTALAEVRANPDLCAAAFAEGVRLDAPLMTSTRMALEDFEYYGLNIPRDTPVHMVWAAGNRDPRTWEDPDTFRLDRHSGNRTTFGGGAHICPGRNAAGVLGEVALRALTAPSVQLELVQEGTWAGGMGLRQLATLDVAISRAVV